MTAAELLAQITKLATEAKKRSSSAYVDQRQDQIVALAKQLAALVPVPAPVPVPEPVPVPPPPSGQVIAGLTVAPTSGTVEVGQPIQFTAYGWVSWQSGPVNPPVVWTATGGTISAAGWYVAGAVPGTYEVAAKLVNGPQEEIVPVIVMAQSPVVRPPSPGANPTPVATKLAVSTQPAGARDSTLMDTQPAVRLQDVSSGNVLEAGRTVTVAITSGTGSLSGTLSKVTDSSGIATFTDLKIVGSGSHTLRFTSSGLTQIDSSAFTVNAASKVVIVTHPSTATSGVLMTNQPVVRLQDANSLNVTKSGVTITASKASGSGSLAGTTGVATDASGVVTYSDLTITGADTYTLQFASTGLTTATSNSFTVNAAGGVTPDLEFDPDNFASSAALRAATANWGSLDNAHPFVAVEDIGVNSSTVTLETSGGYNGRTKFMRYNFTGSSDVEVTVGRMIAPPHIDSGVDVWIDCAIRLSANFEASFSANSFYGVPAWKMLFMNFPGTGRFQQTLVWGAGQCEIGDAAAEDRATISYPNIMDGQWHRIQWHVKVSPTVGKNIIYVDGVQIYSRTGDTGPSDKGEWYGFCMGRNSNRGYAQDTTVDWGLSRLYWTADPGWGF